MKLNNKGETLNFIFSYFSCMFLNLVRSEKPPGILLPKIVLNFHCLNKLFKLSQSWPSASNFKSFSRSLEHFFLTVGQNNFGSKIPFLFVIQIGKMCNMMKYVFFIINKLSPFSFQ